LGLALVVKYSGLSYRKQASASVAAWKSKSKQINKQICLTGLVHVSLIFNCDTQRKTLVVVRDVSAATVSYDLGRATSREIALRIVQLYQTQRQEWKNTNSRGSGVDQKTIGRKPQRAYLPLPAANARHKNKNKTKHKILQMNKRKTKKRWRFA
jgi:hypothetical protein